MIIDYKNKMSKLDRQREIFDKIQLVAEAFVIFGILAFLQSIQP